MNGATLQEALAAHQRGDLDSAIAGYRAVLAALPQQADALALLGVALSAKGEHESALASLSRAVAFDPRAALFRLYLGNAQTEAGDLKAAAESFTAGGTLAPDRAEFPYNLGNVLRLDGAWSEAGEAYERALALDGGHVEARNNLASVLAHFERFKEACAHLQKAVADAPDYFDAWLNLCNFAEKEGDFELAFQAGVAAAQLRRNSKEAWLGLGVALNKMGRDGEALAAYREAVRIAPDWTEAWDNLGQTCQFLGRLDEAEAAYRKTIELAGQMMDDDDVLTCEESALGSRHWHLALLELLKGDLRHGFARYRARFAESKRFARPDNGKPVWRGQDVEGKIVLIYDEQGMGDALMMVRYLPLIEAWGAARVLFVVHPALVPVLGSCGAEVIARGQPVPDFDFHASIFDLPFIFGTNTDNIPVAQGYVPSLPPSANTALPQTDKLRVGIVWAGAPLHKHDARRSVPLALLRPLLARPEVRFYSLNRDKREGDAALLAQYGVSDLAERIQTFGDTARFIAQMDLVLSCDTSTAHLAGAMGRPVWTLLPFAPDWRWLTGRTDSPWYASMRLFRQRVAGDWAGVIADVGEALDQMVAERPSERTRG